MRHWLITFVLSITVLVAPTVIAADGAENYAILEEISFEPSADTDERVILKLNTGVEPSVFMIKGKKPRLVADFFETRFTTSVKNKIITNGQLVKSIRVGKHNDPPKTRVVIDLDGGETISYKLDYQGEGDTVVITFQGPGQAGESDPQPKPKDPAPQSPPPDPEPTEDAAQDQTKPPEATAEVEESLAVQEKTDEPSSQEGIAQTVKPEQTGAEEGPTPVKQDKGADEESSAEETVERIIADIKDEKPMAADPVLLDITFESTANDSEMVLFKLNDFYPPLVFGIEKGNPRVVCDFLDTSLGNDVRKTIQTDGIFVNRIRTALHPSPAKVRVVLDLVPNKNYDLQQVFFKEDNLFVIIINEFEKDTVNPLKTVPKAARTE